MYWFIQIAIGGEACNSDSSCGPITAESSQKGINKKFWRLQISHIGVINSHEQSEQQSAS